MRLAGPGPDSSRFGLGLAGRSSGRTVDPSAHLLDLFIRAALPEVEPNVATICGCRHPVRWNPACPAFQAPRLFLCEWRLGSGVPASTGRPNRTNKAKRKSPDWTKRIGKRKFSRLAVSVDSELRRSMAVGMQPLFLIGSSEHSRSSRGLCIPVDRGLPGMNGDNFVIASATVGWLGSLRATTRVAFNAHWNGPVCVWLRAAYRWKYRSDHKGRHYR